MKIYSSNLRSYFTLIALLAISSCTVGCKFFTGGGSIINSAVSGSLAIADAAQESKAKREAAEAEQKAKQEAAEAEQKAKQALIDKFKSQPVVAWVESILPLYQQCSDSENCMGNIISKYLATQIKATPVPEAHRSEYAYQFETRSDWCYLVFEENLTPTNTKRLIDSMSSDSLTTLSPYDDIQKFRAKAEYANLDLTNRKFHVEGICSVLPTTAARKRDGFIKGSTPIIIGWPRIQVPEAIAMMAEVELHELKQGNVCPSIDRSAEYTWQYTIEANASITVQRIPQQSKTNTPTFDVNCSHPYALVDYFRHPVPGTLVWNANIPYVIAGKTARFETYTVLRPNGDILQAPPEKLSILKTSPNSIKFVSLDSKCSCTSVDPTLPEKYQVCKSQTDPFTCCENLLRTDIQNELNDLQKQYNQANDTLKSSIQPRLLLLQNENYIDRQVYARCGLDNTKAYDNIEKLLRAEDPYMHGNPSTSGLRDFSLSDLSQHFINVK